MPCGTWDLSSLTRDLFLLPRISAKMGLLLLHHCISENSGQFRDQYLPALTTSNAEEEVERFYEHLQDLLELIPKKDVLFIIGEWNAKVSQEIPGVTGKFGPGVQNKAGQRPTEFCQENALVIANTLFQQHK